MTPEMGQTRTDESYVASDGLRNRITELEATLAAYRRCLDDIEQEARWHVKYCVTDQATDAYRNMVAVIRDARQKVENP
jgi:hypothetical protein